MTGAATSRTWVELLVALDHLMRGWRAEHQLSMGDQQCALELVRSGPLVGAELCRRTGLTSAALTALADRLEQRQLLVRVRYDGDRRKVLLYPTKGLEAAALHLFDRIDAAIEVELQEIPQAERESLRAAIPGIARAMEAAAVAP